jgi:flagellar hook-basal body complex protein FliE
MHEWYSSKSLIFIIYKMKCLQDPNDYEITMMMDRKGFFCSIQDRPDIWEKYFIMPHCPSTNNFMIESINKSGKNTFNSLFNSFFDKENYCNTDSTTQLNNSTYSDIADTHQIDFFMHKAKHSLSMLYTTALMAAQKLSYMAIAEIGLGANKLISYLQAVKNSS